MKQVAVYARGRPRARDPERVWATRRGRSQSRRHPPLGERPRGRPASARRERPVL